MAAADAAKPIPMLASRIRSYCNSLPCANSIPTIAVNIMSKFTLGFVSETNSHITTDSLDCDDDDVVDDQSDGLVGAVRTASAKKKHSGRHGAKAVNKIEMAGNIGIGAKAVKKIEMAG